MQWKIKIKKTHKLILRYIHSVWRVVRLHVALTTPLDSSRSAHNIIACINIYIYLYVGGLRMGKVYSSLLRIHLSSVWIVCADSTCVCEKPREARHPRIRVIIIVVFVRRWNRYEIGDTGRNGRKKLLAPRRWPVSVVSDRRSTVARSSGARTFIIVFFLFFGYRHPLCRRR